MPKKKVVLGALLGRNKPLMGEKVIGPSQAEAAEQGSKTGPLLVMHGRHHLDLFVLGWIG